MMWDDLERLAWLMGAFEGFCGRFIGLAWKWSMEGLSWACGECLGGDRGWNEGSLSGEGVAVVMPFILGRFVLFILAYSSK
jgi:hypothetical protein